MDRTLSVLPFVKFILGGVVVLAVVGYVMSRFSYEDFLGQQIKHHNRPKLRLPFRIETDEEAPYKVEPKQ